MRTVFLLMAMYDGKVIVPVDVIRRDFFEHLTIRALLRKVGSGEIALPIIRTDPRSQKSFKGIHIMDLVLWIDRCRNEARRECEMRGWSSPARGVLDPISPARGH